MSFENLSPDQLQKLKEQLGLCGRSEASATTTAVVANAVSVKVPPIWTDQIEEWFVSVEAQFTTKGITQSFTKFNHILAVVDGAIHAKCCTAIKEAQEAADKDKYDILKKGLIEKFGKTQSQKDQEALTLILDNLTPVELDERFRSLLTNMESLYKTLLLRSLPEDIGTFLAGMDLPSSKDIAKRAHHVMQQRGLSMQKINISTVNEACAAITKASTSDRKSNKFPRKSSGGVFVCQAHTKYGRNAYTCKPGCSFEDLPLAQRQGNGKAGPK